MQVFVWLVRATPYVMIRPWLWITAARFVAWPFFWRSWPYLKFRHETMYGNTWGYGKDIVSFLYWARNFNNVYRH